MGSPIEDLGIFAQVSLSKSHSFGDIDLLEETNLAISNLEHQDLSKVPEVS